MKINIENYEAYYLDFLENNLSQEDTEEFLQFLESNPTLKLENDSFISMDNYENLNLSTFEKSLLKKEEHDEEISQDNAEYFVIASVENLLSDKKEIELSQFEQNNQEIQRLRKRYQKTKLNPNLEIVYPEKQKLKKVRILPIFISISSVAAILIFIFTVSNFQDNATQKTNVLAKSKIENSKTRTISNASDDKQIEGNILPQKVTNRPSLQVRKFIEKANLKIDQKVVVEENSENKTELANNETHVDLKDIENHISNNNPFEIEEHDEELNLDLNEENKTIKTSFGFTADMENPYKFFTKKLSSTMRKEVDFGQTKKNSSVKKLFIKIGKLEFYRTKRKS